MHTAVTVNCPFCGEDVELSLDPDSAGTMVQDCEVCCRPWRVHVEWAEDGEPVVEVGRD